MGFADQLSAVEDQIVDAGILNLFTVEPRHQVHGQCALAPAGGTAKAKS
jgi:hypothetical protein